MKPSSRLLLLCVVVCILFNELIAAPAPPGPPAPGETLAFLYTPRNGDGKPTGEQWKIGKRFMYVVVVGLQN